MKTLLAKGLKPEAAEQVKAEFKSSAGFRENFVRVLLDKNKELYSSLHSSLSSFSDKELWALDQASKLAEIRANEKIIELL